MFDATLKDREQSFDSAPGTTMFLHWLVGMVYVFYFASFILLLREVSAVSCVNLYQQDLFFKFLIVSCVCVCVRRCSGPVCFGS